jgi:hypothetical protein
MGLKETGIDGMNWTWLAHDRVQWQAFVSTVMKLQVPERKQAVVSQVE